jgi:hypothetical protein
MWLPQMVELLDMNCMTPANHHPSAIIFDRFLKRTPISLCGIGKRQTEQREVTSTSSVRAESAKVNEER